MQYSLSKYTVVITPNTANNERLKTIFGNSSITIGGKQGNYYDSISVSVDANLWSVQGFATGAFVHNKNLDRSGSVTISLSQLSPQISKFITLCNYYYNSSEDGYCSIYVKNGDKTICTCSECYISSIPEQRFGESATTQTWSFVCGSITYETV